MSALFWSVNDKEEACDERGATNTIFVNLGFFQRFETVTNIRTWINHTNIGECCKMQIL